MLDIKDFNAVFPPTARFPYIKSYNDEFVSTRRTSPEKKLFFDRLSGSTKKYPYPPHDRQQLQALHHSIVTSKRPLHEKQELIFYLLLDFEASGDSLAETFAGQCHLATRSLIRGLRELDHKHYKPALEYLMQRIASTRLYADAILHALLTQSGTYTPTLPSAFFNAAAPPLATDDLLTRWVEYLATTSVASAYFFLRTTQPAHKRRQLFEKLIAFVLSARRPVKEEMGMELVGLPLEKEEEEWLEVFLVEGRGRELPAARETVLVRRVASGRLSEALGDKTARQGSRRWMEISEALERGLGPRKNVGVFEM
ncbi:hypothetical protein K402DRAFT_31983 [Aulographum hederae CBS 113979]|uniref:ELYS-like domain-containing protein n=1 Tax=Aulographum hederae CBS 113979 TaxID=1176131 RepID=A0A6G1H5G1_9PEZI|nr:hypothetical protein K402DRAFT_31983 [Aulographum hederae CBS 113979]